MLSFETTDEGNVQIHCDQHGIAVLLEKLAYLLRNGGHVHLCAPSGGGKELSDTTPFGKHAISEVIIDFELSD